MRRVFTLARACHLRSIEEVVDVGQIRQMTREAASFLPATHSSMRTASPPPLPDTSAVERMSAMSGREPMFGAQDHKLEWIQSELTSLHSSLSEERKKRMELEAKLQECLDHVRQSSTAAAADLQALAEDVEARQKADAQTVAQTVEVLNEKAEAADAQMLQLENDSSEVQTTMHMVMNMLENCIDAKEARTLVDGCMRRIEESEAAIKQHVDENKAALTAEAEDRDAQTNQTTKLAIESIEAIEAELQQHVEKLDDEVIQLQQLVSTETANCVDSLTKKVNGDVAALEERLRAHVEDFEKSAKEQLEQETAQLGKIIEQNSETVRSQVESLQRDLDSAKAHLSQESKTALISAKSELQTEAKTIRASLDVVKSSLTQNLEVKTNEIQRAIATVAVHAEHALEQLQDARQHLESKIDARSQEASAETQALDVKYKEQCEHLRELVTNVVAEHTKHMGRLEGVQHDLRQESTETRAQLDELKDNTVKAVDSVEQQFHESVEDQARVFKKLLEEVAAAVDVNMKHVRDELWDKLDGAAHDTRKLNDLVSHLKQESNAQIEGVQKDVTMQCEEISARLQRQLTDRLEAAQRTTSAQIDETREYSHQQMEEISDSFKSLLAQADDEMHAVHTEKYEKLETGLKDLRGVREEVQLEMARTDDRFQALRTLQRLMHRSDVHDVFHQFARGRQTISKTELRRGLMHFDLKVTESELNELWVLLDRDDSGDVDFEEFSSIGKMHTEVRTELAELGNQAQQRVEALRTEVQDHGASVKNDIEAVHHALRSHADVVANAKGEAQTMSQQLTHTLDLAHQRTEAVKKDLKEQLDAAQDRNEKKFESLRGEISGTRSEVSSVDSRTTQLETQLSTAKAAISAGETKCQELDREVLSQQSKTGDLSEKLERAINEATSITKKFEILEDRHETSKMELTARAVKEEEERHQLAATIHKVVSESAAARTLTNDQITSLKSDIERRLKASEAKSDNAVAAIQDLRVQHVRAVEATREESTRQFREVSDAFDRRLVESVKKIEHQVEDAAKDARVTADRAKDAMDAQFKQVR